MDNLAQYVSEHPWLVAMAVVAALRVIVFEIRARRDAFAAVSPQDLIRIQNQCGIVLDLRSSTDYAAGHIGSARDFDSAQILTAHETLRKYKEKPVIVYCESGSTGASAARVLSGQGFTQAYNLRGGLEAWRADNLPLALGSEAAAGKGKR